MLKAISMEKVDMRKVVLGLLMLALFVFVVTHMDPAFAGDNFDTTGIEDPGLGIGNEFPWTKMLNALAKELTGPLPMTLGILGLAAAAVAMFTGNGGGGTQKFIMLIFAVSTCLFAPTFISWIRKSATGATLNDVIVIADVVKEGVRCGAFLP